MTWTGSPTGHDHLGDLVACPGHRDAGVGVVNRHCQRKASTWTLTPPGLAGVDPLEREEGQPEEDQDDQDRAGRPGRSRAAARGAARSVRVASIPRSAAPAIPEDRQIVMSPRRAPRRSPPRRGRSVHRSRHGVPARSRRPAQAAGRQPAATQARRPRRRAHEASSSPPAASRRRPPPARRRRLLDREPAVTIRPTHDRRADDRPATRSANVELLELDVELDREHVVAAGEREDEEERQRAGTDRRPNRRLHGYWRRWCSSLVVGEAGLEERPEREASEDDPGNHDAGQERARDRDAEDRRLEARARAAASPRASRRTSPAGPAN